MGHPESNFSYEKTLLITSLCYDSTACEIILFLTCEGPGGIELNGNLTSNRSQRFLGFSIKMDGVRQSFAVRKHELNAAGRTLALETELLSPRIEGSSSTTQRFDMQIGTQIEKDMIDILVAVLKH